MVNSNFKVIIPARMDSKRLPGKPLLKFNDIPMVIKVAQNCEEAVGKELVVVSTPDNEIIEACDEFGVHWIKSSLTCNSGTDRLYEYALKSDVEVFINVQGDEPFLTAEAIRSFCIETSSKSRTSIGIVRLSNESTASKKSIVKVAMSNSKVIYASRLPVATLIDQSQITYFKHVGIYSFTRSDIQSFGVTKPGPLELLENIEILRLIELGISVHGIELNHTGKAIDTIDDYESDPTHEGY